MVSTVKKMLLGRSGFSLVEVVVSMVVIGFVALMVGLVMTSSSRFNAQSRGSDEAYEVARQKLVQLQYANLMVQDTSTTPEIVVRNGKSYTVRWKITPVSANKRRADINVTYPGYIVGTTKKVSISGYVRAGVCPPTNNGGPTALSPSSPTVVEFPRASPIGTQVCVLTPSDPDPGEGFSFTITGGNSSGYFKIVAASIVTNMAANTLAEGTTIDLQVTVKDCKGNPFVATVKVKATNDPTPPTIADQPMPTPIPEIYTGTPSAGTVITGGGTPTGYQLLGANASLFDISGSGEITVKPGAVFDYETTPTIAVSVKVSNSAGNATATVTISLSNVNEAPTNITSVPAVLAVARNSTPATDLGITFTGVDPDVGNVLTYTIDNASDNYFTLNSSTGVLSRKTASIPAGTTSFNCTVRVTDAGNLYYEKVFTIAVNPASSEFTLTAEANGSITWALNSGGTATIVPSGATAATSAQTVKVTYSGTITFTMNGNSGYTVDQVDTVASHTPKIPGSPATLTMTSSGSARYVNASFKTASADPCNGVATWSSSQPWTDYTLGDKRVNAGKLWQCKNVAYSTYEPSSADGTNYGWTQIGTCGGSTPTTYTVSPSANSGGTISPTASATVTSGDNSPSYTATPNSGFTFSGFTVTNLSTSSATTVTTNPYSIPSVAANYSIVANFSVVSVPTYWKITLSSSPSVGGTDSGSSTSILSGSSATIKATANAGYRFVNFKEGSTVLSTTSPYTLSSVTADRTIVANFKKQYSITSSKDATTGSMGSISPSGVKWVDSAGSYADTATANSGKAFDKWLVDGATQSTTNPYVYSPVTANRTLVAYFKSPVTYTITPSVYTSPSGTGGTISPSGATSVTSGNSQTFTVAANSGYVVDSVTVDGAKVTLSSGSYTFTNVTANHTIKANFKASASGTTLYDKSAPPNTDWTTRRDGNNGNVSKSGSVVFSNAAWQGSSWYAWSSGTPFTITSGKKYTITATVAISGVALTSVTLGLYNQENTWTDPAIVGAVSKNFTSTGSLSTGALTAGASGTACVGVFVQQAGNGSACTFTITNLKVVETP